MKKQTSEDFSKRLDELDPKLYEMEFKPLTTETVGFSWDETNQDPFKDIERLADSIRKNK